jgi:hypothetical protein
MFNHKVWTMNNATNFNLGELDHEIYNDLNADFDADYDTDFLDHLDTEALDISDLDELGEGEDDDNFGGVF